MLCALALAVPARAQTLEQAVELDPGGTWLVLPTAHFEIVFEEPDRALADEAAAIAEEVYANLSTLLGYEPETPVRIVVAGSYELTNGFAIPFPFNQVQIFVAPPRPGQVLADTGGNWMRLLLSHELTHIFHLDRVRWLPRLARWIFGRAPGLGTWHTFAPMWLIEGMATYSETLQTGHGRIGDSLSEAVIRQAALAGEFPSIDQATTFDAAYPAGNTPYLFGGHFIAWLARTQGRDKLREWIDDYAAMPIPYAVDLSAHRVFGKGFPTLWEEWRAEVTRSAHAQAAAIAEAGTRPGELLVEADGVLSMARFLPDGYAHYWHDRASHIRRHWRVKPGTAPEPVSFNVAAGELVTASDGVIYGTNRDNDDGFSLRDQVVRLRWPEMQRDPVAFGREPTVSPDGNTLVFVRGHGISTYLMRLDLGTPGAAPTILTDPAEALDYADPVYLADGESVAVSIYESARRRLWRVSAKTGARIAPLLPDDWGGNEIQPMLSPDGKLLAFASDRSGIYDIYLLNLETSATTQLTRVLGAALEPVFAPGGDQLLFVSWEAKGRALRTIPVAAATGTGPAGRSEPLQARPERFVLEQPPAAPDAEPRPYSPLPTLVPRFWMPTYTQASNDNLVGAWTSDEDLLRHWFYSVSAYYGLDSDKPRVFTSFGYSRIKAPKLLNPLVYGTYSRDLASFGDAILGTSKTNQRQVSVFELRETARVGFASGSALNIGLVPFDRDLGADVGYRIGFQFERRSALDENLVLLAAREGANPAPFAGSNLAGFFLRVGMGRTWRSAHAISPELGAQLVLESEFFHEGLGGDYSTIVTSGDLRAFVPNPLFDNHVFAVRLAGGTTRGDRPLTRAFVLGGSLGQGLITLGSGRLSLLRGIGESSISGDHYFVGNAEYRMPVLRVRQGAWNLPGYLKTISLAGFIDAGNAWDDGTDPRSSDIAVGAGAEVIFDLTTGYYIPTPIRVGVARGLKFSKSTQYYLRLGRSF